MNRKFKGVMASFKNSAALKGFVAASGTGFITAAVPAHAAIETTDIVAAITAAGVAAGVVGIAYLVAIMGIKAFKLVRAAM